MFFSLPAELREKVFGFLTLPEQNQAKYVSQDFYRNVTDLQLYNCRIEISHYFSIRYFTQPNNRQLFYVARLIELAQSCPDNYFIWKFFYEMAKVLIEQSAVLAFKESPRSWKQCWEKRNHGFFKRETAYQNSCGIFVPMHKKILDATIQEAFELYTKKLLTSEKIPAEDINLLIYLYEQFGKNLCSGRLVPNAIPRNSLQTANVAVYNKFVLRPNLDYCLAQLEYCVLCCSLTQSLSDFLSNPNPNASRVGPKYHERIIRWVYLTIKCALQQEISVFNKKLINDCALLLAEFIVIYENDLAKYTLLEVLYGTSPDVLDRAPVFGKLAELNMGDVNLEGLINKIDLLECQNSFQKQFSDFIHTKNSALIHENILHNLFQYIFYFKAKAHRRFF